MLARCRMAWAQLTEKLGRSGVAASRVRTGSLRTQSARHWVDHGTISGRSCANSGHYKPLCARVDRTKFVRAGVRGGPEFFLEAPVGSALRVTQYRMASMNRIRTFAAGSVVVGIAVLALKYTAYVLTGSVALLSDAIESIVNVATAVVALLAVRWSAMPADAVAKVEAKLVPPPRKCLSAIVHGDDEAEAKEKALAEHVARHPEEVGRMVKDFNWILHEIVRWPVR
jgi:Cation efflux family